MKQFSHIRLRARVFTWLGTGWALLPACLFAASPQVDFKQQIQPLFEVKCISCHGPEKQKGGLRLDQKSNAMRGGDTGVAIEPGKPDQSLLFKFVAGLDPEIIMPPKSKKTPLTSEEVASLKQWIEQGAPWPEAGKEIKHWAYLSPRRPVIPQVAMKKWPRNEIDFFVLARIEKEKLKPSNEADPETLIRRASLDLIGLPPTPEEVDAFLADKSSDAYEKLVDRLLASPHYGERWARSWLDLARYADTQGFEKDGRRSIWPYRDWVIHALNQDLPFSQFTIKQLAGDLLPNAGREEKVATGFHRNTMTNTEGGTDDEEFRNEAVVDRVNTTMSVWMGTTMACAQCHNHKYDPITMKEYYRLYAFLNTTADSDKEDEKPFLQLPTPAQEGRLNKLRETIASAEKDYNAVSPELDKTRVAWEKETLEKLASWKVTEPAAYVSDGGATLTKKSDQSILVSGTNPSNDVYRVTVQPQAKNITGLRLEVLPDSTLPKKSLGRHSNGSFVLSRFEVTLGDAATSSPAKRIRFKKAFADYSQKDFNVTNLIAESETAGWAVSAAEANFRVAQSAYFIPEEPIVLESLSPLTITLRHSSGFAGANLGRFRLFTSSEPNPEALPKVPEKITTILAIEKGKRDEKQVKDLDEHFRSVTPALKKIRDQLAESKKEKGDLDKSIPTTPVFEEVKEARVTQVLLRGNFLSKGETVTPGVPAALHSLPKDAEPNRLGFARWLVSEENPLTARVTMNRIWESYFGMGIVETGEDFGKQGELPTHPELLDWMATEIMRQNWSLKSMHRLIATSSTYRQSSRVNPDLLARDPYNRLFARGPRVRLEAEIVRDQALAVSGLLSHKLGGPSVMPFQPDGLWQVVYSGDKWETSKNEDKYRRGLYTFWRRTMPHPAMVAFDAPSREFCVVKRSRSNTPLQALTTLNDPAYVEAAQALAGKILNEGGLADEERLHFAFKACLARAPRAEESKRLLKLLQSERLNYLRDPGAAEKMTGSVKSSNVRHDISDLAAWTVVANVLLNLDEMITKG